jgi:hypothetical protein
MLRTVEVEKLIWNLCEGDFALMTTKLKFVVIFIIYQLKQIRQTICSKILKQGLQK